MDKIDFWFLDSVAEERQPLNLLLTDEVETWFGRPTHGLEHAGLIARLRTLFDRGELAAYDKARGEFNPADEELQEAVNPKIVFEEALDVDVGVQFGLTAQGGAAWEAAARPDWSRFIGENYGLTDPSSGMRLCEICCVSRDVLEKYLSGLEFLGIGRLPEAEAWDTFAPWPATYWKTLPEANRVQFPFVPVRPTPEDELPEWFLTIKDWHGSFEA